MAPTAPGTGTGAAGHGETVRRPPVAPPAQGGAADAVADPGPHDRLPLAPHEQRAEANRGQRDAHQPHCEDHQERAWHSVTADRVGLTLPMSSGYAKNLSAIRVTTTRALARAFFRDASLLVLDEPTASMDARSEHQLFEQVRRLEAGRSLVLISHRFSTVRDADRIYVMDKGRIIEEGSHDDLMLTGGRYAELFELQASAYR